MAEKPLWKCPECGRTFANRNQTHTCAPLGPLDPMFNGSDPLVRDTFDRILSVVSECGPVTILPEKTRIALHVRMSFAAFTPRQHWLTGHLILAREAAHPCIQRVEHYSPRNILHALRLRTPADVDSGLSALLREAYAVGCQHHLRAP